MHAEHFLERLDRLDDHEVPDALALYYNPPLVRQLLAHAPERGHGNRVAISLDDPHEGPYIIVTQDGDFVTALGRGMSVSDLPVVPRSVWDAARREDERMHEAFALARAVSNGKVRRLWDEILTRGPHVTREAMTAALAIGRLMDRTFLHTWTALSLELSAYLKRALSRDDYRSLTRDDLVRAGRTAWAAAHVSVIVGASDLKKRSGSTTHERLRDVRLSMYAMRFGMIGPYCRGLWTVSKLGPLCFPALKDGFRTGPNDEYILDAALGLASVGLRFRKYRGEVRKLLTIAETDDEDPTEGLRRSAGGLVLACAELAASPEQSQALLQAAGERYWVARSAKLPVGHPLRFEAGQAIPPDVAVPAMAAMCDNLWRLDSATTTCRYFLAAATLDAEAMYYPRAVVEALPPVDLAPWTQQCFTRMRKEDGRATRPVTVPPKPGRNDPCPCGSGQKYKRCCGE